MKCYLCNNAVDQEQINPFVTKIKCPTCHDYYIELPFISLLAAFKDKYGATNYQKVIKAMQYFTQNHVVVFTADFNNPYLVLQDAIYLELEDLAGYAKVVINDVNSKLTYGS